MVKESGVNKVAAELNHFQTFCLSSYAARTTLLKQARVDAISIYHQCGESVGTEMTEQVYVSALTLLPSVTGLLHCVLNVGT